MKELLTIIILICLSSISLSQNLKLDNKNGFKTLKLGMNYGDLNNKYNFNHTFVSDDQTVKALWSIGDNDSISLGYLFTHKITAIDLSFDRIDKTLKAIYLIFYIEKPYTDHSAVNKYIEIVDSITEVYGSPNYMSKETIITGWFGEKTGLSIALDPTDSNNRDSNISVTFFSTKGYINNTEEGI